MKSQHNAELEEGPDAFKRFRKAMKTIDNVPKGAVVPARKRTPTRKKKATR